MMTTGAMEQTGETMLIEENAKMKDLLRLILKTHGTMLMSEPPQEPWKYYKIDERIREILGSEL